MIDEIARHRTCLGYILPAVDNRDNPLDDYKDQFGGVGDLVLVLSKD